MHSGKLIGHRKMLIEELDFDANDITSIFSKSKAFKQKRSKSQQGYATKFSIADALAFSIGCGLLKINLPFRYVDAVLDKITGVLINKLIEIQDKVIKHRAILIFKPINITDLGMTIDLPEDEDEDLEEGLELVVRQPEELAKIKGKRIAPMSVSVITSEALSDMDTPDPEFIVLKLYEYMEDIHNVVKKIEGSKNV